MKKPAAKKRAAPGHARERLRVISLGLPPSLIDRVDAIAVRENRSRANMIVQMLERVVSVYEQHAA
jgi:hypothetical protein